MLEIVVIILNKMYERLYLLIRKAPLHFKELFSILEEILDRLPYQDIYFYDDLILLLDDFTSQKYNTQELINWKRIFTSKFQKLLIKLDKKRKYNFYFQRKFLSASLLFLLPFVKRSKFLQSSLSSIEKEISLLHDDTIEFLESFIDDLESAIINNSWVPEVWEERFSAYFRQHQGNAFKW